MALAVSSASAPKPGAGRSQHIVFRLAVEERQPTKAGHSIACSQSLLQEVYYLGRMIGGH